MRPEGRGRLGVCPRVTMMAFAEEAIADTLAWCCM